MTKPLNDQQKLFVAEYIISFNGKRAAIAAGYSERSSENQASRLLRDPRIIDAVATAMEDRIERTKVNADWVLHRAAAMMEADIADIIDDENRYLPIKRWPKIWRQMLAGIDIQELFESSGEGKEHIGDVTKIKFIDRLKALDMVGRHVDVQAFREKIEVEVVDKAAIIAAARARAGKSNG